MVLRSFLYSRSFMTLELSHCGESDVKRNFAIVALNGEVGVTTSFSVPYDGPSSAFWHLSWQHCGALSLSWFLDGAYRLSCRLFCPSQPSHEIEGCAPAAFLRLWKSEPLRLQFRLGL